MPDIFRPETDREKRYTRILLSLLDTASDTWVTRRSYRLLEPFQSPVFDSAFVNYERQLIDKGLAQGSILLKQQALRDFLLFVESEAIYSFCNLKIDTISRYLLTKERFSTSTKSSIIITLRDFMRMPEVADKLLRDFSVNLRVSNNGRYESLPSLYSTDEIRSILSCIDRATPEGKKDFAIILLAVSTGIRSSDIINLKVTDIKWSAEAIDICQVKTGEYVSLTVSDTLRMALLDYLMNARPKNIQAENLFLRSKAPYLPYVSAGHFYKRLNRYFKAAGVNTEGKRHGIHSLRHNLATRLMQDDVPITVTSEAMGHKYANVTKQYIRIDIDKLRLAALEVSSNG